MYVRQPQIFSCLTTDLLIDVADTITRAFNIPSATRDGAPR